MKVQRGKGREDDSYTIKTSAFNEKPELMGLECRNCGGVLELTDRTHAVCPYCGQKYLIDEAKGTVINIQVDYSGNNEMRQAVNSARNALIIFLSVAAVLVVIILGFNIAAKKSVFSSSDSDLPGGQLLQLFFTDIFGKEYKDITAQELAGIRYIKCSYENEKGESFNSIAYSFTDYKDCESEEEFQDTIETWTYRTKQVTWPSDYTMLTGLTRIDTTDSVWMSMRTFSPDNHITCVDTDDRLDTVASLLNPEQIEVLHIGTMGNNLDDIGQFKNLTELEVDTNISSRAVDLTGLGECGKLKRLRLRCGESYTGLEGLEKLSGLESLSIDKVELGDCTFLENMPLLRELSVYTGEDPDLSVLEKLPNLRKVDFLDSNYIPVEELAKLGQLEELTIAVNEAESLSVLAAMESLRYLDLHMSINEYQVPVDVSPLAGLVNLEYLYMDNFWGSDIIGIEPVLQLPVLKVFRWGDRFSTESSIFINPILVTDNQALEEIGFLNCIPRDLETGEELGFAFLSCYPGVKRLYLDGCELTDISFVADLQDLRRCSLQDNKISDLSPLTACKKLELISVDAQAAAGTRFPGDVTVNTESYITIYE